MPNISIAGRAGGLGGSMVLIPIWVVIDWSGLGFVGGCSGFGELVVFGLGGEVRCFVVGGYWEVVLRLAFDVELGYPVVEPGW